MKCKQYIDTLKTVTRKLFPSASDKAKHTVYHLADHNEENEHTNTHSTSATVNLPKQHFNDVLLEIPIATEFNTELPFLTDDDVTTFLDNCKHV